MVKTALGVMVLNYWRIKMHFGRTYNYDEDDSYYDRNHPAVDSDGYVEDWWKHAADDSESSVFCD